MFLYIQMGVYPQNPHPSGIKYFTQNQLKTLPHTPPPYQPFFIVCITGGVYLYRIWFKTGQSHIFSYILGYKLATKREKTYSKTITFFICLKNLFYSLSLSIIQKENTYSISEREYIFHI